MLLFWLPLVVSLDMIEQEIQHTRSMIDLLHEKLAYLSDYRTELASKEILVPDNQSWKSMPGLIPQPEHDSLPSRLNLISTISKTSKAVDFIALKSKDNSPNIAIVVCDNSLVSVYTITGEVIGTYAISKILFCAGSSTPEDSQIAVINDLDITILSFDDKGINLINSNKLFNDTASPTNLINYSRLGKKYWLVGDDLGRVTFYSGNGEALGQGSTGLSRITVLDKFGSQVVFAGDDKLGVFNLATMDVYMWCEPCTGNVIDIAQDFSATIIYAACSSGDILIYDTKHVSSSSAPHCKSILKFNNLYEISKIAVIRNSLLAASENVLTSYNVTYIEQDIVFPPVYYKINVEHEKISIKSLRLPNAGNYLLVLGNKKISCFDISMPRQVVSGAEWGNFGSGQFLYVAMVVGGFLLWKMLNKSKDVKTNPQRQNVGDVKENHKNPSKKVKFNDVPQTFNYSDSD